jgi:3-hydroxyacyl-[acyl-carrier protein] dehydratase/trans-2-decenoyl-[acyl-carrier protein] isomerase
MASLIDLNETYLPIGQMRQITGVTEFRENTIVCQMDLADHWVFQIHFPGDPIMPGSLIIEAAGQVTALWAWMNGQRGKPRMVKASGDFRAPVGPRDGTLTFRATVKKKQHLNFGTVSVLIGDVEVGTVSNCIAVV